MISRTGTSKKNILAFDFGGTKVAIATADSNGIVLSRKILSTDDFKDAISLLDRAIIEGKRLLESLDASSLVSVGVSTMGITFEDNVIMAPNVVGWSKLRLPSYFRYAFPNIPITIENDVKSAAIAELRHGALKSVNTGIYVNLGTGIAVVFIIDGRIVHGYQGSAGEIGYSLRDPNELRGFSEGVAPLEEFVGGKGIRSHTIDFFNRDMEAIEIFQRVRDGDSRAREFINSVIKEIAFHLSNLAIAWNPEVVVFGGGMVGARDLIFPIIRSYFEKFVPFPPQLLEARFKQLPALYGAIELALDCIN